MKKTLIFGALILSCFGFSQTTKKKVQKKPVQKTITKKVVQEEKPIVEVVKDRVKTPAPLEVVEETPTYIASAERILKKRGWINNRNSSYSRGIEGFVKGVYSGQGKIFVLLVLDNKSNINYDIESIIFLTQPSKRKNNQIDIQEKPYIPIWSNQPETLNKKSSQKIVFVFDKFTIAEDKNLMFAMNEIDGERTLKIEIKPQYILEAEYIN